MARLVKNILILALAGALSVLAIAALLLFLPPALRLGVQAASRHLPFEIEIDSVRHVPGRLALEGVRLSSARGPFCEIGRLEASYRIRKLFALELEFTEIALVRPFLDVRPLTDGSLESSRPSRDEEPEEKSPEPGGPGVGFPLALTIRALRIEDGRLLYSDGSGIDLSLDALGLSGKLAARPLSGEIDLKQGILRVGAETPLEMGLSAQAAFREGVVRLAELSVIPPGSSLLLRGEYSFPARQGRAEAEMQGIPLGRILAALGVKGVPFDAVSGTLSGESRGIEEVTFECSLIPVLLGQEIRVGVTGRFQDESLVLETVRADHAEASLNGNAAWLTSTGDLTGKLHLKAQRLERFLAALGVEGMSASGLSLSADLGGKIEEPLFRFQASAREFAYRQPVFRGLSLQGQYSTAGIVRLDGTAKELPLLQGVVQGARFHLRLDNRVLDASLEARPSLHVKGVWNEPDHSAEAEFRVRKLSVAPFLPEGLPPIRKSWLTAQGSLKGDPGRRESWTGEMRIEELDLASPGLDLRNERPVSVSLARGRVQAAGRLLVNQGHVSVEGHYPLFGQDAAAVRAEASLSLEGLEPLLRAFLPELEESRGTLEVRAALEGPRDGLHVSARIGIEGGAVTLVSRPAETGEREASSTSEILRSQVSLSADLDGPLRAPQGTLFLDMTRISLYGISVDRLQVNGESDGKGFRVREARVSESQGSLLFTGQGDWTTGTISGEVESTPLPIQQALSGLGIPLTGKVQLDGKLQGTFRAPQASLLVRAQELEIQGRAIPDLSSELEYGAGRLALVTRTSAGSLEAAVRLTENLLPMEAKFDFEQMPLDPLLSLVKIVQATGGMSLSGELAGPLADPAKWKGQILFRQLRVDAAGVPVSLSEPAQLALQNGLLSIPEARLGFEGGEVRLRGTLGAESDFALQGKVPMRLSSSFLPWLRIRSGEADLDVRMTGPLRSPHLEGSASLDAQQVSLKGFAYPFDQVLARLHGSPKGIHLDSLVARAGDGEIRAAGMSTLAPFKVESLEAKITSLPVRLSEDLAGRIGGTLSFSGNAQGSRLGGNLRILEARYGRDFQVVGAVLKPSRPTQAAVRKPSAFLNRMDLDLHVASGPDLFVRNNVARIILSLDLDIQGTAAAPIPLGKVEVVEGEIYLLKKKFEITEGSLSFVDPTAVNPMLHVESRVDVRGASRDYVVFLSLDGPLDRIELKLRSIPELAREDIVFVLVAGKTQQEYFAAGPADQEDTATQLALSGISLLFGEDIRRATGLDVFELEAGEGQDRSVKTILGKRMNERTELRGVFAFGSAHQASEAQVEYKVTDTIFLVGTQRTDGSFGLDVRLRFIYK